MSQGAKEFIRRSGIAVSNSNSNSNNDNFARELEQNMLRRERERAAGFRTPPRRAPRAPRPDPFRNEFALNANNQKMINNIMKEFDDLPVAVAPQQTLQISALKPGMYNATVNREFGKEIRVDLKDIMKRVPLAKTSLGNGLYVDTKEIKGWYGQFKTGFSHTRNYGMQGNLDKNFFSVQFSLEITDGNDVQGSTVNIYRNGKIRFSGGFVGPNIVNQPERIRRFVVDSYTNKDSFLYNPFSYNNLSGQFRINGFFDNLTVIALRFQKYGMTRVSYEPELAPFLYAYFENATFIVSKSGNIQISGAKTPEDMTNAYEIGKNFIRDLNADGQVRVTGVFEQGVKVKAKKVVKPTTNVRKNKPSTRMKKAELVNMARKLGVVNFKSLSKEGIMKKIQNKSGNKVATVNNVSLSGTGKTFRVGKVRCDNLSKKELLRVAVILKIKPDPKDTKITLCKKIEKVRNNIAAPAPKSPPRPQRRVTNAVVRRQAERNAKKVEVMKKRGLDENSIRKDIAKLYGEEWMKRYKPNLNQDVRNMKRALSILNKGNKLDVPFKKDIDQIKKSVVSGWKMARKMDLEKKYLMNTVNVTGINYRLENNYRRAAANFIMSKKKPPSKLAMNEYRKYWLKFKANANANGNSRRVNKSVRARVEKV